MAAALEPAATALAADGICELHVARGGEVRRAGVEHRVDLDGIDHNGPRASGSRAELLGECRALVQRDGHEQSSALALAKVGEGDGGQGAVRAAQPRDPALVDCDPRRAQPLGVPRVELSGPVGEQRHIIAPGHSRSARRTPEAPPSSTSSGWSRTSQPLQKGQWNTERPHRSAIPGNSG